MDTGNLNTLLKAIQQAEQNPRVFFGVEPEKTLKFWQIQVHPDKLENKILAHELFTRLSAAFDRLSIPLPKLTILGKEYELTDNPVIGDTSDVHFKNEIIKIGRLKNLSLEFAKTEEECLKVLYKENFSKYLPKLLDRDKQCGIIERQDGFTKFTDLPKLPGEHIAWLTNRLLEIVGFAHYNNITHGGITPDNIIVFKKTHGIHLLDWKFGGKTKVSKSKKWLNIYPEDDKVSKATDIYMLFKTIETLCDNIPERMKKFFNGCTLPRASMRPDCAWSLHDEFKDVLFVLYGKRKFVELL